MMFRNTPTHMSQPPLLLVQNRTLTMSRRRGINLSHQWIILHLTTTSVLPRQTQQTLDQVYSLVHHPRLPEPHPIPESPLGNNKVLFRRRSNHQFPPRQNDRPLLRSTLPRPPNGRR